MPSFQMRKTFKKALECRPPARRSALLEPRGGVNASERVAHLFGVISFDCYGTLIDWESGILRAFADAARKDGVSIEPAEVLKAYAEIEPLVEAKPYQTYRKVLAETAVRLAARHGWTLTEDRARFLPESLPSWKPFPDTNPALSRLASAGYKLGILSNVDEDLLEGTVRHISVAFDLIVTAEQVRSYKPAHGHFLAARARLDPGRRWLHAAQSYFHDIVPAKELGIPVAWINRKGETHAPGGGPDYAFRNLTELADWLERS